MDVSSAAVFGSGVSSTRGSFSGCYQYLTSIFHTPVWCRPIRLTTISHAFNYRVAVLRDGVKSAARVSHSRRAEGRMLEDTAVPWGHQVAVMFQIVSVLALVVPAFLQNIGKLRGVSPDVQLSCEPWGHAVHNGGVANVFPRIVRVPMLTVCLSYLGRVCLGQSWRTSQSLLGKW